MSRHVIKYLTNLAEKHLLISALLSRILCLYHVLSLHKIYADRNLNYRDTSIQINKTPPPLSDERTNFIVRVLIENNYKRVIEIGAYDLSRPLHYKRILPNIEVFALDIIPGFRTGIIDGIHTARFDLEWFSENALPHTIITSSGTLPCFKPEELDEFLYQIYDLGYDIAVAEPGSHFAKTKSLKRSLTTYYHPYTHLLKQIGYSINVAHPNHAFSLSMLERREFIYASSTVEQ